MKEITIVEADRPDSNEEAVWLISVRNSLSEMQRILFDKGEAVECDACSRKAGTPALCAGCLANRLIVSSMKTVLRKHTIPALRDAAKKPCARGNCGTVCLCMRCHARKALEVLDPEWRP